MDVMRGLVGFRRAACLGLAALALGACVADQTGSVSTPAAVRVPAGAPKVTGRERATDADHQKLVASFGGEAKAPAVTRLLTEVTDRLVKGSDRPDQSYAVTLLDSPVVNAFALPNGRLYVTRGLVALANDTSEVAAVLAHEIAHVTLNHATARSELELRSALVSKVVADVLNDPDTGAQLKSQSRFALARFSREQELEADAAGVKTLAAAGYDPFAAARFLTALNRTVQLKQGGGTAGEPDMLATHPGTAERVNLATRAARKVGAPGIGSDDRSRYLAAIDGLAYGDSPRDGVVRSGRFIHSGLGIAFAVPEGFSLENTRSAVLGTTADGNRRLLFDQIETKEGQGLDAMLKATWNDSLDPAGFENRDVNGNPGRLRPVAGQGLDVPPRRDPPRRRDLPDDHGGQGQRRPGGRLPALGVEPRRGPARGGRGPAPDPSADRAGGQRQCGGACPAHGRVRPRPRPVPRPERPGARGGPRAGPQLQDRHRIGVSPGERA